jgi:UDP-N-acetylglucosamine 2-epimerase
MAALASFTMQFPVGHVEAGLRTHHRYDPFPEENNRQLIGRIATWHFAPTNLAKTNLLREGVSDEIIWVTGNTAVDASLLARKRLRDLKDKRLARSRVQPSPLTELIGSNIAALSHEWRGLKWILLTAHRRENWGEGIRDIATAVRQILSTLPDVALLWPLHANPAIRQDALSVLSHLPDDYKKRLLIAEPLDYPALIWFMERSWLVLTDSGGIQEEAITLNVPVLILRETTERPEVVEANGGKLVGSDPEKILAAVTHLVHDDLSYSSMKNASNPFGNGSAGSVLTRVLMAQLTDPSRATTALPRSSPRNVD